MVIDINQIITVIVNHIPALLIVVGIIFLFLAFFNVDIKPPTVKIADKLSNIRKIVMGLGALLFIIGLCFPLLAALAAGGSHINPSQPPAATRQVTSTNQTTSAPETPSQSDAASSLIPAGQQPVISDPLKDNSAGYQWDVENSPQGSCNFVQGRYLLAASAGTNNGVGCTDGSPNGFFGNFVYQVQMTILTGVDTGDSGAGAIFRATTSGNGQQYQVLFDISGDWQVEDDKGVLSGNICANPCPHFHTGADQANFITIRASGDLIQVQINGYSLGSYTDTTYSSGALGVQMNPGTENSSVAFSNLRVWTL